jgi:hypothetical protein
MVVAVQMLKCAPVHMRTRLPQGFPSTSFLECFERKVPANAQRDSQQVARQAAR